MSNYQGFINAELENILPQDEIRYEFMGDTLRGFRGGCKQYTSKESYKEGIKQLLDISEKVVLSSSTLNLIT